MLRMMSSVTKMTNGRLMCVELKGRTFLEINEDLIHTTHIFRPEILSLAVCAWCFASPINRDKMANYIDGEVVKNRYGCINTNAGRENERAPLWVFRWWYAEILFPFSSYNIVSSSSSSGTRHFSPNIIVFFHIESSCFSFFFTFMLTLDTSFEAPEFDRRCCSPALMCRPAGGGFSGASLEFRAADGVFSSLLAVVGSGEGDFLWNMPQRNEAVAKEIVWGLEGKK
ncbi:DNA binding [Striga asiatica]|uniref:DNA binding n=1 Tax=Striga asiatica TaxID=4170 RepID=A0A5A7PRY2_STRAF|nr:DNA binding [Striga asiatica]